MLQDTILKCQILLVEELAPLELRTFSIEIARFCQIAGGGIKSHLVTALVWDKSEILPCDEGFLFQPIAT